MSISILISSFLSTYCVEPPFSGATYKRRALVISRSVMLGDCRRSRQASEDLWQRYCDCCTLPTHWNKILMQSRTVCSTTFSYERLTLVNFLHWQYCTTTRIDRMGLLINKSLQKKDASVLGFLLAVSS